MTTFKDIILYVFLFISVYILTSLISSISIIENNLPWTFPILLIPIISYIIVLNKLKRRKRVSEFIKNDLSSLGYNIVSERPLTFAESFEYIEWDFGPFVNNVSVNLAQYKSVLKRCIIVINKKEHYFELVVTVRQTWSDKFQYRIENTSRIRDLAD